MSRVCGSSSLITSISLCPWISPCWQGRYQRVCFIVTTQCGPSGMSSSDAANQRAMVCYHSTLGANPRPFSVPKINNTLSSRFPCLSVMNQPPNSHWVGGSNGVTYIGCDMLRLCLFRPHPFLQCPAVGRQRLEWVCRMSRKIGVPLTLIQVQLHG